MKIQYLLIPAALAGAAWMLLKRQIRVINITSDLPRKGAWNQRQLSDIDDITIHHAASSKTATPADFARHHIDNKGWPGIGYHFVVDRAGRVFQTNPLTAYSYHNGYDNKGAIGICMVGNLDNYPPTPEQYASVLKLCRMLKMGLNIRTCTGHKEYPGASTACPGAYINMGDLRRNVGLSPYGSVKAQKGLIASRKAYDPETADN